MITVELNVSVMATLHLTVVVSLFLHGVRKLAMTANPVKTLNAVRDHTAYSRSFPNWIREKEILIIKITQNLSYSEARKLFESRTLYVGMFYRSLLK